MTPGRPGHIECIWRDGPPTAGISGFLYDFARRFLVAHGGTCSRQELLD